MPAVALEEGPARAQEQEPRIQPEVDRVPAAVREVTTAAASGVALSLAMEVAMAPGVDQAPVPAQAAAEIMVQAQPEAVAEAEERGLVSGSPEKKESTAFCAR